MSRKYTLKNNNFVKEKLNPVQYPSYIKINPSLSYSPLINNQYFSKYSRFKISQRFTMSVETNFSPPNPGKNKNYLTSS